MVTLLKDLSFAQQVDNQLISWHRMPIPRLNLLRICYQFKKRSVEVLLQFMSAGSLKKVTQKRFYNGFFCFSMVVNSMVGLGETYLYKDIRVVNY